MPYVPAHTNAVGSYTRNVTSVQTVVMNWPAQKIFDNTNTYSSSVRDAQSARTALVKGQVSTAVPGFLRATPYTRGVVRLFDESGGYDFRYSDTAGRNYRVHGSDSRHSNLITAVTDKYLSVASPIVDARISNRARAEALLKVQEMKLNLGAFLGEARQTIGMVAKAMERILLTARALRHGNIGLAYRHLFGASKRGYRPGKDAANAWLEWTYGWSPLISDIYSGVELLQQGFRSKHALFSVTRTVTEPLNPLSFISSVNRITTEGQAYQSSRVELYGMVEANVAALNSLGLVNPLSLAWELTSLSFVIDWLVPIGNWLESLTATVGIRFVNGYETQVVAADVTGQMESYNGFAIEGKRPKARTAVFASRRSTFNSWPWAFPYWVNPLTSSHLTSAVALLKSRS